MTDIPFPPGVSSIATGYWYDGWDFGPKYAVCLNDTNTKGYWKALIRQDGYTSVPWRFTWLDTVPDDPGTQLYDGDYDELPLPVRDTIHLHMRAINSPYVY